IERCVLEAVPVGDDVVEPGTDETGRDGPDRDVADRVAVAAGERGPPPASYPDRDDGPDGDEEAVGAQLQRPDRDRVVRWAREGREDGEHHPLRSRSSEACEPNAVRGSKSSCISEAVWLATASSCPSSVQTLAIPCP